jgi:hypothetical protein
MGTPAITLGFTREELDAIEQRCFPDSKEAWLHGLVMAVLNESVVYEHCWATQAEGDATRVCPHGVLDVADDGVHTCVACGETVEFV